MDEREFRIGRVTGRLQVDGALVPVARMEVDFAVETEGQLRELVDALGGIELFFDPENTSRLLMIANANEIEGLKVQVNVWLGDALAGAPRPTAPAVVQALIDAKAAKVNG